MITSLPYCQMSKFFGPRTSSKSSSQPVPYSRTGPLESPQPIWPLDAKNKLRSLKILKAFYPADDEKEKDANSMKKEEAFWPNTFKTHGL